MTPIASRATKLPALVRWGLVAIAAVIAYLWMSRLGWDLKWDEAFNFRVYARNPVTALALYNEHNNHPLETVIKCVFYSTLGMDAPHLLRITGFLFAVAYLVMGWVLVRDVGKTGAVVAAAVLGSMLLLPRATHYQVMELRGYFLSIALQFLWLLILARDSAFLERPSAPRRAWSFRTCLRYALLSAALAWTLPTNVLVLPALWLLTVAAWSATPSQSAPRVQAVRRFVVLGVTSAVITAVLYAPIIFGLVFGFSKFHNTKGALVTDVVTALRTEVDLFVSNLAPHGMSVAAFGWGLAAVCAAGAVAAFLPGGRLARLGVLVIAVSFAARAAVAAVLFYPFRVRCALIGAPLIGLFLIVHALTVRMPRMVQAGAAVLLLAAILVFVVPPIVNDEATYRLPSEIASFLDTYCRPGQRETLVLHANLEDPLAPVTWTFGADHVATTQSDLDARLRGTKPVERHAEGTWKRKLRDLILPPNAVLPIDSSKVEVLVLIDDVTRTSQASTWTHSGLAAIKARLARPTEFRRGEYRVLVFE